MLKWCKTIHTFWTLAGQEMVSCHKWSKGLNRAKYRHQFYASSFWVKLKFISAILFPEAKGLWQLTDIPDLIRLKRCRCAGSKIVTKIANKIVHTVFCLNRSEVWWVSGICGNTHCIVHTSYGSRWSYHLCFLWVHDCSNLPSQVVLREKLAQPAIVGLAQGLADPQVSAWGEA